MEFFQRSDFFREGSARSHQFRAHHAISDKHSLELLISKITLKEECFIPEIKPYITPLSVIIVEKKDPKKIIDVYYFDAEGVCSSHQMHVFRSKERDKSQQRYDFDIGKLIEYGTVLQEMVRNHMIPSSLMYESVVRKLRDNTFSVNN